MDSDRTALPGEPTVPLPFPYRRDAEADGIAAGQLPQAGPPLPVPAAGSVDLRDDDGLDFEDTLNDADAPPDGLVYYGPLVPAGFGDTTADTQGFAEERRPGRVRAVFRETLETVLLALLIFISVRAVIQNFKVEGSSMEPNLHSGQYLLVNKAAYFAVDLAGLGINALLPAEGQNGQVVVHPFGAPGRGDVIVFRYPKDPRRDFIKRVIAVPGDTVEVRLGRVLVNGQMLHEPYIVENPAYSKEPQVVPAENYYVLGDNRNNSSDSHVWGPVPREFIIGKAWLSYWPLSEWGLAPNYTVAAQDSPAP